MVVSALVSRTVDIIVPVYRGERETRECLESVLAAASRTPHEVVAIDDCSPEPAISSWLRTLAAQRRLTLIEHAANRGFVASANEGMALHPDRDVVLLNSDTEVAGDWLDRLTAAAHAAANTATVTPLSTNATICSYPRTLQSNAMPPGETAATLDAACAAVNAGLRVEIPTAVGFCMYIRRDCLNKVGSFDEARYGLGYGEEVDFCMRAARAGLHNLAAADVFVRHVGEISFGSTGLERRAQAQATVDALYPEFQVSLRRFIPADPLRMARRRVDLERLRRSPQAVARTAQGAADAVVLEDAGPAHARLHWARASEELELWLPRRGPAIARVLATVERGEPVPHIDPAWLFSPAPGTL
jgi:GT2 family glycosyltransferase